MTKDGGVNLVLMSIIGWGAAALFWKTLSDVSEKQDMNAYPSLNKKDFDLKNMARGVDPKDVYRIAARCRVRLEDGVLPYYKYNDCLSYVWKHATSPSDVDEFILNWKRERHVELKKQKLRVFKGLTGKIMRLLLIYLKSVKQVVAPLS